MDIKDFTYLLQHPGNVTKEHTGELEEILIKHPYFQAARALRLKGLKENRSFSYNSALKKTAAYTTDRSVLFDYITSPEFNQNQIAEQIKEQDKRLKDITVFEAEEVHGKRSMAIGDAIKMKQSESERVMDPALFGKPEEKETPEKRQISTSTIPPEEELKIGEPLDFNASESHSFSEWLRLTSAKPVERETSSEEKEGKIEAEKQKQDENPHSKKFDLIDEFISKSPRIKPGKIPNKTNLAERNSVTPEALMTETLAKVYLEQKNYKKAIQAYKILILKNPEKSGFFADQIRAIEKLQENNTD
ncbi:hypothetical protein RM549_16685 [Salegentibacter sp. F188]|uniref:Tetratricopeptide repeat protein n=1 Tax=Autumnicola patrickiae TaxID=3075591 RepID=A0ABU3E678_9FLAO|nr:hypothetical protein [Salegentibacter sp. F188]MDT0691435.1 hypothetical protein [Salegentibacter sp. F188]